MTVLILLFGGVAIYLITQRAGKPGKSGKPAVSSNSVIPVRVIDPLGGEDEEGEREDADPGAEDRPEKGIAHRSGSTFVMFSRPIPLSRPPHCLNKAPALTVIAFW